MPDVDKMYSSLFFGDDNTDPRWIYLRVCAFRMEVYPHKQFFKLCNQLIDYILLNYRLQLVGVVKVNNGEDQIDWNDIKALNFNERQLDALYKGVESNITINQLELLDSVRLN
jgi:hypothetical protein